MKPFKNPNPVRFTTAPEAYDYGYTRESETFELGGRTWRRVSIQREHSPDAEFTGNSQYHIDYQCGRYGSGLYPVLKEDPRKDPIWN